MIVDRRKDSYDELQILAGDVRTRRRRANIVTTILLSGGIVGTVAFIATMNQQVDALAGERDIAVKERNEAVKGRDALEEALRAVDNSVDNRLADLRAQVYENLAEHVANMANGGPGNPIGPFNFPSEILVNGFPDEIEVTGIPEEIRINGQLTDSQPELINLVYIVNGSRRFPMTVGDVLWLPEGQFWVRLEEGTINDGGSVTRHDGASVPNRAAVGESIPIGPLREPTRLQIGGNVQGVAQCITLGLGEISRAGFGFNYFDVDVRVLSDDECADP